MRHLFGIYTLFVLVLFSTTVKGQDYEDLVKQVTIYRDGYGVPHVHGETDAAAVFGLMYAFAEDHIEKIERSVLYSTGRLAELDGEKALNSDMLYRSLETEQHARDEYVNTFPAFRRIADAWAAGLNYYRMQHPEQRALILSHFEPWHMLARARILAAETPEFSPENPTTEELIDLTTKFDGSRGSSMLMIGPERSVSGYPMLLINPHISAQDFLFLKEGHLISDEGLNIYGGFWPGEPFPMFGHTPQHGWAVTVNFPDLVDMWELTFDHPNDSLAYRYRDGYRKAVQWTDTILVHTESGMEIKDVTFRKAHYGPIIAMREGKSLAVKIAKYEQGGYYQQRYAMARARNMEVFKSALGMNGFHNHNIGYADTAGNIMYVYNSPVPKRSEKFDWDNPLDGSNPETEWQGYHSLEELPQVVNPTSGWIVNTNTSPFEVTSEGKNPNPAYFPEYMVGETGEHKIYDPWRMHANNRLQAYKQIITAQDELTFNQFAEVVTSRYVFQAVEDLEALVKEWKQFKKAESGRAETLKPYIDHLVHWDKISDLESTEMTLYMQWSWEYREKPVFWGYSSLEPDSTGEWMRMQALEKAIKKLKKDWSSEFVPWGEISRLQRPIDGTFSDLRQSTPVAGSSGLLGVLQEFNPMPEEGQKRWYGRGGNSYVSIIEFGPQVKALTIMPFGQSSDPDSPHYDDQSELYGRGEFKQVWTTLEEVKENAIRVYRPGESSNKY